MQFAALTFIVALAFGIVALTLLYLGSAVVVLERFARVSRWSLSTLFFWILASLFVGAAGLEWTQGETRFADGEPWTWAWGRASAIASVLIALSMVGVRLLFRWIRPARLAEVSVALLATAATWAVAGMGEGTAAITPAVIAGLLFGFLVLAAAQTR